MLHPDRNDLALLARLRQNAREGLSSISRATGIPVTTLFYKHRKLETALTLRYSSLIDFAAFGCAIHVWLLSQARSPASAESLRRFLSASPAVNSAYRASAEKSFRGAHYLAEAVFRDACALQEFANEAHTHGARTMTLVFVSRRLKEEEFLTRPEHCH